MRKYNDQKEPNKEPYSSIRTFDDSGDIILLNESICKMDATIESEFMRTSLIKGVLDARNAQNLMRENVLRGEWYVAVKSYKNF